MTHAVHRRESARNVARRPPSARRTTVAGAGAQLRLPSPFGAATGPGGDPRQVGQSVRRDDGLGRTGVTDLSAGPGFEHLHFEAIRVAGVVYALDTM